MEASSDSVLERIFRFYMVRRLSVRLAPTLCYNVCSGWSTCRPSEKQRRPTHPSSCLQASTCRAPCSSSSSMAAIGSNINTLLSARSPYKHPQSGSRKDRLFRRSHGGAGATQQCQTPRILHIFDLQKGSCWRFKVLVGRASVYVCGIKAAKSREVGDTSQLVNCREASRGVNMALSLYA